MSIDSAATMTPILSREESIALLIVLLLLVIVLLAIAVIRLRSLNSLPAGRSKTERKQYLSQSMSIALRGVYDRKDFKVLVFGPGKPRRSFNNSPRFTVWQKREEVRSDLKEAGFLVLYGEDLCDIGSDEVERNLSPSIKEKLFALDVNVILILTEGVGAIAEVTELSQIPEVCPKLIVAVHDRHSKSYLNTGPVRQAEALGAKIVRFTDVDIERCHLRAELFDRTLAAFEAHIAISIANRSIKLG
jgi:hypothetical protein